MPEDATQPRENLRVRRTRTLLRRALVELIEEQSFERLTVGEIAERAMVSRAAFYRNYRDKYHVVEEIFDDAMAVMLAAVDAPDARPVLELWTSFFEHIARYDRLYAALLSRSGSQWFTVRMRASLGDMVAEHLDSPATADGLVPTLVGAMFVQAITWWLENDQPVSAEQMATRTGHLAGSLIAAASRWPPGSR
ncbi:TetR/AcrR family transcriptional regulator [Yinghuangia aomiensis]|uniref:TetR/AcrR family transcriptional regulator n=1 Tax=Yinghuangia aomiensis TaxID=676205 RepID=A0ABP9HJF0_9ACTN